MMDRGSRDRGRAQGGWVRTDRLLALGVGVVLATLGSLVGLSVERLVESRTEEELRSQITEQASALRARLEGELKGTVALVNGLTAVVGAEPSLELDRLVPIARRVADPELHVRNVTVAPDNVIQFVYPLAGNHQALGLDIEADPEQGPSVRRMMESRQTVIAGPFELAQGGKAVVVRSPIFDRQGEYWGATSVPISLGSLYRSVGLLDLDEESQLAVALRGRDGLGEAGGVFFGSEEVFEQDPVTMEIHFDGSTWQLGMMPARGWAEHTAIAGPWYALWGIGVAFLAVLGALLAGQASRLRELKLRLQAIVETIPDQGLVIDDRGQVREVFGGREFTRYYPLSPGKGRTLREVFSASAAERFVGTVQEALQAGRLVTLEYALEPGDIHLPLGDEAPAGQQWYEARVFPLPRSLEPRPSVLWLASNITERKRAREEAEENQALMRHLALHDHLTGLANRALLLDRLTQALAEAQRHNTRLALLFIDLNRFKPINDQYGHEVGDTVLKQIAKRLTGVVRESDTVSRYGGDEFVILLEAVDGYRAAERVAEKLIAVMEEPFELEAGRFEVRISCGIALYPDHGMTPDALQRVADDAMYVAKRDRSVSAYAFGPGATPEKQPD